MKKKAFKILGIILIFGLLGVALSFFFSSRERAVQRTVFYGNIDIKEVGASFRVSGRLKSLNVDEGDFVKAGGLLATLEEDTFKNELEFAKANLAVTKARLANAEKTLARAVKLIKTEAISRQQYDDAYDSVRELRGAFASAKAQVKIAEVALSDTKLLAPSDGFVITRTFEVGTMLGAGQAVFTISLLEPMYARIYVPEPQMGLMQNGAAVLVKTDEGREYEGQVGYVSPKAEFTPKTVETAELRSELVYRARILILKPDLRLKQGMPITVVMKND